MGINKELWRCRIGSFSHAANTFERCVAYIEVAVCTSEHKNFTIFPEGIEANPGPESTNFELWARVSSTHSDRRKGRGKSGTSGGRGRRRL